MAISNITKGTFASGNGAITPGLPANMVAGDLCLLFVESANEAISISTAGSITWTEVTNSPVFTTHGSAAAADVRLAVYYGFWSSGTTAPTIADSGNHTTGIILSFRNVNGTTPFDATPVSAINDAVTTDLSNMPGITTATANALVVYAIALDEDANNANGVAITGTLANAALTSIVEQHSQTVSTGVGGGLGIITGYKAEAGASGAITGGATGSSTKAYLTIALKPAITHTKALTANVSAAATMPGKTYLQAGYHIERKTGSGGTYAEIAVDDASPYADSSGLVGGNTYYYKIRHCAGGIYGDYSNEVSVAFAAAGSTTQKELTANATAAASRINKAKKVLVGASAITGSVIKLAKKVLTGSAQAAGGAAKNVKKTLAASLLVAANIVYRKVITKALTAATSCAGLSVKKAGKKLAGTVAVTGVRVNKTQKILIGQTTSLASGIKKAYKTLSAVGTITGIVGKGYKKLLSAAISAAASFTFKNVITKTLIASMSLAGSVKKRAAKILSSSVVTSGSRVTKAKKNIVATVAILGVEVKKPLKRLAGTVVVTGSASKGLKKIMSAATTLTAGFTLRNVVTKTLTATVAVSGNAVKSIRKTMNAAFKMTAARVIKVSKILSANEVVAGSVRKVASKMLISSSTLTGYANKGLAKVLTAGVTISAICTALFNAPKTYFKTLTANTNLGGVIYIPLRRIKTIVHEIIERLLSLVVTERTTTLTVTERTTAVNVTERITALTETERVTDLEVDGVAKIGNSVKLYGTFKNYLGELADPAGLTVTVYDGKRNVLVAATPATKESLGVWYCEYTVPATGFDPLVYEFNGTLEGSPVVDRATIDREWV